MESMCRSEQSIQGESSKRSRVKFEEEEEVVLVDEEELEPEAITCPDSEFNDFTKTMDSFEERQVWALYHSVDNMPRCYGRIKRVIKSKSSLQVTWIVPKDEERASSVGPVSCGRFEFGITETQGYLIFSHEMVRTIKGKHLIEIYPQVGETWALFRDWSNNPEQPHKPPFRYDFVEITHEFDANQGIGVAYLGKVQGFVSVFQRAEQHRVLSFVIRPEEMKRFSHRVPSFELSGEEKEGIPAGSFELDPAALPSSVFEHDQGGSRQDGSRQDDPIIIID